MVTISNKQLTVKVNPLGAELSSIINRQGNKEYLWQADPVFWKRHSPILFPIVGSVWDNEYRNHGVVYAMSQHGFARDMDFELVTSTENEVFYELVSDADTLQKYPFPFLLRVGYCLQDNKLEVIWEVTNTGDSEMHFQIGAHPAFNYLDFDEADSLKGYFSFDKTKDLEYLLIEEKGCVAANAYLPLTLTNDLLPIDSHTFDKDALILENSQVSTVSLLNKQKQPYVSLHFNTPLVGLWSPARKNAPFVCIEPWYGRCDGVGYAGELKDRDWMNHLEAGKTFRTSYIIEIN